MADARSRALVLTSWTKFRRAAVQSSSDGTGRAARRRGSIEDPEPGCGRNRSSAVNHSLCADFSWTSMAFSRIPTIRAFKRCFVFLGPARQLLVQHGRHANLKMDHGFRHGNISSNPERDPEQDSVCRVPSRRLRCSDRESGHAICIVPEVPRELSLFSREMIRFERGFLV